jgi:hypothetical protein
VYGADNGSFANANSGDYVCAWMAGKKEKENTRQKISTSYNKAAMKKIIFLGLILFNINKLQAQVPCSGAAYRQFDFWIGEWEAYGKNGQKAGDSKISVILDGCIILEEWTSAGKQQGLTYTGKSFNTYNSATKQWQQTWVDNTGGTTEYLRGESAVGKIIFFADKVAGANGKIFRRRLSFTKLNADTVRQSGEKSDDEGKSWVTEYDLEYRRKK